MAQQIRALIAVAEDQGLIPNSHMVGYNHRNLQFYKIQHPPLVSSGTRPKHGTTDKESRENMHTHKIKNKH